MKCGHVVWAAALKRETGFTLVEMLIVIAIIGILSATAITYVSKAKAKARCSKAEVNLASTVSELSNELDSITRAFSQGLPCATCQVARDNVMCRHSGATVSGCGSAATLFGDGGATCEAIAVPGNESNPFNDTEGAFINQAGNKGQVELLCDGTGGSNCDNPNACMVLAQMDITGAGFEACGYSAPLSRVISNRD